MMFKLLFRPFAPAKPDLLAHQEGSPHGNKPGHYDKMPGHLPDGRSTAERSTGIEPLPHNPILPQMPNISPP